MALGALTRFLPILQLRAVRLWSGPSDVAPPAFDRNDRCQSGLFRTDLRLEADKPIARTKRQLSLGGTFSVQFRRIDVGYADLLAFKPDCVTIMDAVVVGTGSAHSESGSEQKHSHALLYVF